MVCPPRYFVDFDEWTTGYTGRMCTGCLDGYTRWGARCYECPASGISWAIYGIISVCVVLSGIVLWLWLRKDLDTDAIKTLLFFTQVLALLPSLGISVPGSLGGVSEVSTVSSLAIPGLSCVWKGYDEVTTFWFKWLLFITILTLVCCINGMRIHFWGHSGTVTAGLLFLVTSFYLPLSSLVFRFLRCEWDACLGESFFVSAPHTSCATDRAVAVRVMAWLLVVVFVLGVPFCLGCILRRARKRDLLSCPSVQGRLGQLYMCYTEERWWWEGIVTPRRLLIAAFVTLIPMESGIGPLLLFALLVVSSELHRSVSPYRSSRENQLELLTLFLLEWNLVGVFTLGVSERLWARQFVAALLAVGDAVWILVLVCMSVRGVFVRLRTTISTIELHAFSKGRVNSSVFV